jgi:pyrimidine-nucleoside phosphorylase
MLKQVQHDNLSRNLPKPGYKYREMKASSINPVTLIEKKRDGGALSPEEISGLVRGYVSGSIPDYQMSAFLMAVVLRGMDDAETRAMTEAYVASGDVIDLSSVPGIKVDKHSTGGVGDKVSLILAPLAAAAGVPVPMMAGRGLGHTGGTLDKLESIPGFSTQLSESAFRNQVASIGCAIMGQTERVAPADRKIYALRDVTGTVPSLPLICSSILGKKKAEGTDALVLDVKLGRGAFFRKREETVRLAKSLVSLGSRLGIRSVALLTAMDQPLGRAVGNWLEVRESVDVLRGSGPEDVLDVTLALGAEMLVLGGKARTRGEGTGILRKLLNSGAAYDAFIRMVKAQGGDASVIENPEKVPRAAIIVTVESPSDGWVAGLDALAVGEISLGLGAGRMRKEDAVDPFAGIVLNKKTGDRVRKGETLAVISTNRKAVVEESKSRLIKAFQFSPKSADAGLLIEGRIDAAGEETAFSL